MSEAVNRLALWMYYLAGISLTSMVFLTVMDVMLRLFKHPIVGTYELVGFLAAWAIGFAIPQTTITKGQVMMEFLTGRLSRRVNKVFFSLSRLLGLLLFVIIAVNLFAMGRDLWKAGEVSLTLHLPQYPLALGLGFACVVECLVLLFELINEWVDKK